MGFSSAHAARAALPAVVLGDLLSDLPEVSNWELRSRMEYRCTGLVWWLVLGLWPVTPAEFAMSLTAVRWSLCI